VVFDYDGMKLPRSFRNVGIIIGRNRQWVKEIAAVIQLEHCCRWQALKREINLPGNSALWRGSIQRVLPEVAHHTVKNTFATSEQNCHHLLNRTCRRTFFFDEETIRHVRVDGILPRSQA
jgi:hypothetical protein